MAGWLCMYFCWCFLEHWISAGYLLIFLHCALSLAEQCIIGPVCNGRALWLCGSVTTITQNCLHRSSSNWVWNGVCSDHLQPIKFWLSCAPGKGLCGRAKIFGSASPQPARSVCVSPSAFFISHCCTAEQTVLQSDATMHKYVIKIWKLKAKPLLSDSINQWLL